MLDRSIWNYNLCVSNNHFFRNLYNLDSKLLENKQKFEVNRNTFEISGKQKNKTIKFKRRFCNLQFKDNEFVLLKEEMDNSILQMLFGLETHGKSEGFSALQKIGKGRLDDLKKANSDVSN